MNNKHIFTIFFIYLSAHPVYATTYDSSSKYDLETLINYSINHHPSIRAKRLTEETYLLEKRAAYLNFLPGISYVRSNTGGGSNAIAVAGSSFISANLPIFTGGASIYGLNRSTKLIELSQESTKEAIQELTFKVISGYSEWLRLHLKLQALIKYDEQISNFKKTITTRIDAGIAAGSDLQQVYSRELQIKADLQSIEISLDNSIELLSRLCGEPINRQLLSKNLTQEINFLNVVDLVKIASENSPQSKIENAQADIAELDAKISRAQNLPQVFLTAQNQLSGTNIYNQANQNFYGVTIQFSSSQGFSSIANSLAAYNRAKYSKINNESLDIDRKIALNNEFSEMISAKTKLATLIESERTQVLLNESNERQYRIGKRTLFELLNGSRELYIIRSNIADAKSNLVKLSWKFLIRTTKMN